ncbi:Ig-like domain repeat protein [Methanobrevibacter sp. YE315]|uniref:Ig-like domain repeat protein n=1 Tax=Methanobrevibacter sp. YE315 TaxID=1609968 RepID=UPI0012DDE300|nr:Ig-like domain repeat protein [Methanobrevibacter sp. YE315]
MAIGCVSASDSDNSLQSIDDKADLKDSIIPDGGELTSSNEWYVDASSSEGGDGSRDAPFNNLNSAITHSKDGNTIYIAPGTYSGSGLNVNLSIDKSLNLIKLGEGDVIFDGEGTYQIFSISSSSFNIDGLTFTHGMSDENGGAIYFANGLKDSKINASFIENNARLGGAIYFNDKIINNTFTGSYIRNEVKSNGGAILVNGIANYNTFSADFCENKGNGYYGGAIHFTNHTSDNKFYGNFLNNYIVEGSGGGIVFDWDVNNTIFAANFSNNYVYHFPSAAFEVYGTFYNNTVSGYFENNREAAVLLSICIDNTFNATFINNSARYGGILSIETSINNYFSCIFINNRGQKGSALNFMMDVINTTIEGAFINNTATIFGGAISIYPYINSRDYKIQNLTISADFINNTAQRYGGAVYLVTNYSVQFEDSFFENNHAKNGGAIYLDVANVYFDSCIFNDNDAEDGGAIINYGNLTISNSQFGDNTATLGTNYISLKDNATLTLNNVTPEDLRQLRLGNLILNASNITYGENVRIIANVTYEKNVPFNDGKISVVVNGKTYSADVSDGIGTIEIPGLDAGNYTVNVTYDGNEYISTAPVEFSVLKQDTDIAATNKAYTVDYGGTYSIELKDANGNPVSGKKVEFILDGKDIGYATTDAEGIASIELTPKILKESGIKSLEIRFDGDVNYNPASKAVEITVNKQKAKILPNEKSYNNAKNIKKYPATFKNSNEKAVKKVKVRLDFKLGTYKTSKNQCIVLSLYNIKWTEEIGPDGKIIITDRNNETLCILTINCFKDGKTMIIDFDYKRDQPNQFTLYVTLNLETLGEVLINFISL